MSANRPRQKGVGQARRPRTPLRKRIGRRIPSRGRLVAALLLAAAGGGLLAMLNGPWLRVERVDLSGQRYTDAGLVEQILRPLHGSPLLAIDSRDVAERLGVLPAVESVTVETRLPDAVRVMVAEKKPAFVWLTSASRLIGATDGTLIGRLAPELEVPSELASLPLIDDRRRDSRTLLVGDVLPPEELRMALRLLALEPELLGSGGGSFAVRVSDEHGLVLVSRQPGWLAAFGFYGLDPAETPLMADARLDRQLAALRTLFATVNELNVGWVDVRNPGKVYWRA